MEQRTQPVQADSEQASEAELLSFPEEAPAERQRRWPVFAWFGALALTFALGAQLTGVLDETPVVTRAPPRAQAPWESQPLLEKPVMQTRVTDPQLDREWLLTTENLLVGTQLLSQHELAGARLRADRCLDHDPTNPRCHALLGQIYAEQHEHKLAITEYERAMQLDQNPAAAKQFAEELRRFGPK
jgi:tetratricopeptide (TPR) repeat protein